jgi:beta-lactamase regulating signal transducer with metallopeptidase domain/tetratricopeptide (TPR) repeat protein
MTPVLIALNNALLHFAWQGLAVFVLLWVTLFALRKRSANARYAASCVALAMLAAAPLVTTYSLYRPAPSTHPDVAVASTRPAPAAIVPNPPSTPTHWLAPMQSWVLPVWAFGVLAFSLRMVWGCAQVASLRRRGQPANSDVLSIVASLSRRLGLTRPTRVLISAWDGGPSLVGWLRPVILVPASALAGLTPQQLEAVLAHELAHVRRHDYLVNWMQMLVETLLFYHPAVWWVSSRIRHERELCCDDLAVSACDGPLCYARALTSLEKMRRAPMPAPILGSAGGTLLYRIQRIVGATPEPYGPSRASGIVAMSLVLASLLLTVNWAQGQSQPPSDYLVQGDVLLRAGAHELALQKYRAGIEQDPGRKITYQKRCIEVLLRIGKRTEAYEINAQILSEDSNDNDALGLTAVDLLDRGQVQNAVFLLQQVSQRAPDNPVAHLELGRAYAAQHSYEPARREMEEAIRLRPDFLRAKQELAKLDPNASQSDAARLDEALELGNAAVRVGNYDLAIATFKKILETTEPGSKRRGDVYLRLGETYRRKGESNNAIDALLQARELTPENPAVLSSLAVLLGAAGRHSEAGQITDLDQINRALRHTLVISFLKTELALATKKLEAAQTHRDAEAIRQAQLGIDDMKQRLAGAEQQWQAVGSVLERIDFPGRPESAQRELHLPVQIGETLTAAKIGATITAVKTFDPDLDVQVGMTQNGAAQIVITKARR